MQLDIFNDSRDTMLRNDVVVALMRRDTATARACLEVLCEEYPADESRAPLAILINAMAQTSTTEFADHPELQAAYGLLAIQVVPAAVRMLGDHDGRAWLRPLWCALAQRAAGLPYKHQWSDAHAALLWIQAGEWERAIASVERIESWRRIPAALAWMAEAHFRANGLDRTWDLLIELAWLAPERLDRLMGTIADPLLQRLRRKFDASWEGDGVASDLAWFPVWALIEQPSLVRLFRTAQHAQRTPPEEAMRLLVNIL